jgi:hypothetical protein
MVRKQPQIEHEQSEYTLARREFRPSGCRTRVNLRGLHWTLRACPGGTQLLLSRGPCGTDFL